MHRHLTQLGQDIPELSANQEAWEDTIAITLGTKPGPPSTQPRLALYLELAAASSDRR